MMLASVAVATMLCMPLSFVPVQQPRLMHRSDHGLFAKMGASTTSAQVASLGFGLGTLIHEDGAMAADASAQWGVGNFVMLFFWVGLAIAFFKNNLVDQNGPLAGCFGAEVQLCKASHILVESEATANEILSDLTGGEAAPSLTDFVNLAKERSKCWTAKNGGQIPDIFQGELEPSFDEICFDPSKALGVPHGPVKTKYGYHIIWVQEREQPTQACPIAWA